MMHALDTKLQYRAFMRATHQPARLHNHRYSTAVSQAAATAPIATKQQHNPHPRCRQLHAATQQQAESSDYIQDSPDLMPHVLLTLESTWLNICSNSNNNSTNLDPSEQQQEEQQLNIETCLVPRTSVRLHHVTLPGFMIRPRATEDLMISTWKQQTAQAWHTAVARAQQQQQQSSQQQCTSSQSSTADSWLQQIVHSGQRHWGPAAAVLQACGPQLNLNELLYITDTLVDMITAAVESGSSEYDMYSSSSSSSSKQTSGMFQLSMIALEQPAPAWTTNRSQSTAAALQHLRSSSSSSSSGSTEVVGRSKAGGVILKCAAILPQLTALLLQQLQQQSKQQQQTDQQQQQQQQQELDQNAQHEPFNQSRAVQLLQQIAQLHNIKNLGNADIDLVSELLQQHISLQQCNLHDLAAVISCAGQLNQPLRASWLKGFVAAAVNKVQQQQQDGQVVAADVALLLDGLSLYPGPHIQNNRLSSFLYCCQSQLPDLTPLQLSQLLTATASLNLNPNTMWLEAAAAAVQQKVPDCGFQDLVLLLQGMTAAAAAAAAQDDEYVLDDLWWQSWFEASANRFAAVSLAAAAAAAGLQDNSSSSSMVGSALTYPVGAGSSSSSNAQDPDAFGGFDLFEQSSVDTDTAAAANANLLPSQQQQQRQVVSCNALFDALYVLVQVQREVHPLWLAGALEAYQRSCHNAGSTPQLLLLVSHLVDSPQSFAVRHRALMHHLMQPLQHKLAELNPEQLAQAVEVCVTYNLNLGVEWFRWHSAAILRLNTTFPLQPLARIADCYARLQITPDDFRLQQLFKSISWRLERQQRKQKAQERLERVRATITFKNEQRRRQNLRDKEALDKKKLKWQQRDAQKWGVGGTGMPAAAGPGPEGKAQWRKRKLKPPGTLDKKY